MTPSTSRLEALQSLRTDFPLYAERCLKIRTKSGKIDPLRLNRAQLYVHERLEEQRAKTGKVRALLLKARQQGFSTYIGARYYWRASLNRGLRVFILTHEQDATDNLFEMVGRYHEHSPLKPSTGAASAKELIFDRLDSGYSIGTAGSKAVGRSKTVQLFHGSEVAFWPNAQTHFAGVVQAIPDLPGTEIVLESTANGVGGEFHERWQQAEAGIGDYIAIFVPWFWSDEYCRPAPDDFVMDDEEWEYADLHGLDLDQMCWRRAKMAELKDPTLFRQEYPACIVSGMRVGTNRGIIPIDGVMIGDVTSRGVVSAVFDNGQRECVRVTTSLGYSVECTPDHLLKADDWTAAGATLGHDIELQPAKFSDQYASVTWKPLPCVTSTLTIDEDFGRFLGYFAGDGCWHDNTLSFVCDARDEDVIADIAALVTKFVGTPTKRIVGTKRGGVEIRIGCKPFKEVLDQLGLWREAKPHRVVKVPEVIWRSPASVVRQFLSGLFEADGFADFKAGRVSLFSKHVAFLQDVHRLLLAFGITCRLNSMPARNGAGFEYVAHTLNLRVKESRLFGGAVGFCGARKRAKFGFVATCGRPSRDVVLKDRVVSIDPIGAHRVYDLTIPGEHCFDADGVLAHNCAAEAFQVTGHDSFIKPEVVMAARKATRQPIGPLVLGVDPKREGKDRFSIAWRQGRKVLRVESDAAPIDTLRAATKIKDIIDRDKPKRVFIDAGGGGGIFDTLVAWGAPYDRVCVLVNFGSSPIHPPKRDKDGKELAGYLNRRAEMWGLSRDWLEDDGGADIPDSDALQADACGPGYHYHPVNAKLVLESKDHMREVRKIRSPDEWDSVALTFAEPVNDSTASKSLSVPAFGAV